MSEQKKDEYKWESIIIWAPALGSFGSKLTYTIGTTYLTFGAIGFLVGGFIAKKPVFDLPSRKLLYSYYFSSMMRNGIKYANSAGGAAFIYCITGWGI